MSLLELLIVIILVLWLLGALIIPVGSNLIHVLLVIILVLIIVRLVQGRRVV